MKTDADFFKIWGGISGVQSTLEVMLTAIEAREVSVADLYQKLSANPAKRFGLQHKGHLDLGFDADIALVQMDSPWKLEKTDLHYRHAQSPYLGANLTARVKHTFLRGKTIWDGQQVHKLQGKFLRP
ncbi:MAG: hypothetical protein RLZZ156_2483 [Deinococcota bacterium]|jgi:allantoinase